MHSLAFRLTKPPKTQWSLRQVCVCVCVCVCVRARAQSCPALYCAFESSFLLKVKEIVFSVKSGLDCLLLCHRPPSGNGWLQPSISHYLWYHWELVGLSEGVPTQGLSWGQSPSVAEAGWSLRSPHAQSAAWAEDTTAGAPQVSFSESMGPLHVLTPSWWFEGSSASYMMTQVPKYTCLVRDCQAGSCLWFSFS